MERPRTFEAVRAILPDFKVAYMGRPPVIAAGLGVEQDRRGSQRFVFMVFLEQPPDPGQHKTLKQTFRGVPIRYAMIGQTVAGVV